jgi:hypothetical protein
VLQPQNGTIDYQHLTFDTSALKGTNGTLALQCNPGETPGAQTATATVSSLVVSGGSTSGPPTTVGGASVAADGSYQFINSATLNELLLPLTYGDSVSFDLTLSGAAVAQPAGGSISNTFSVQLLGSDGKTPQSTAEADGAAMTADLAPDGTATATSFLTDATSKLLGVVPNVADPAVAAGGGATVTATAGVAFTGQSVATFTDPGGPEPVADYSATIDWGDGSSSAGNILPADANGTFTVQGSHSYNSAGNDAIAVTIQHDTAPNVTVTSTANVAAVVQPSLTVAAQSVSGTEGASLANTEVATFTLAGASATASDFSATIDWGDGLSTLATVAADPVAGFDVTGSHAYAEEGNYTFTVVVQGAGASGSATAVASITDPAVVPQGSFTVTGTASTSFSAQTVATFTDPGGAEPLADYSAEINWGDSSSSAGNILPADSNGTFTVQGSHSYASSGTQPIVVTLSHDTAPSATATGTAQIAALNTPGITVAALAVTGSEATSLSNVEVATFTVPGTTMSASDFTATIDWGDGSTTAATVAADATSGFDVTGSHIYAEEGTYTFTATVRGNGVTTGFATATATVADPAVVTQGGFTVAANAGIAFAGLTVATFSDPAGSEPLTDYTATIQWGDGSSSTGSISPPDANGTFTVQGSHIYASAGNNPITVTIHHDAAPDATVTSTAQVAAATITGQNGIAATGVAMSGDEQSELTGVTVATFTDGAGSLPPDDFSATIDWGDGSTSAGTVTLSSAPTPQDSAGGTPTPQFTVSGSHEYLDEGHYTVEVSIAQTAGPATGDTSATAAATATIHEQMLADGTVGTPDQKYIQEIYRDLFARRAEMQGLDYWVAELSQGVPRQQVAYQMVKIASFEEFQHDTVAALYEQYLGRAPDAAGLAYWSAYLYDGGTIEGMSQALVTSPEYWQVRAGGTADGFINALFHDALGRVIEPAALTYFMGMMATGASAADLAASVFNSDEYHRLRVNSLFEQFMDRPGDQVALAYFAGELDNGSTDELVISQLLASDEYYALAQV